MAKKIRFEKGDRVAWSHTVATQHGRGSVLLKSVVAASDSKARFGTVVRQDDASPDWWDVQLDGDKTPITLTGDELVAIEEN